MDAEVQSRTLIRSLDVVTVVGAVVAASAALGGPVRLQLFRTWTFEFIPSLIVVVASTWVRHWLRPRPALPVAVLGRVRRWWAQPLIREALRIAVVTRLLVFLVGFLAVATFGHAPDQGPPPAHELAELPERWDAPWYLGIASGGYRWDPVERSPRIAFFPGFPASVRVAGSLLHLPDEEVPWLWTGVAVSCLFFFLGLIYLQKLALTFGASPSQAADCAWLLACYPFALFYGQHYSESLFLFCAVVACYRARRPRTSGGELAAFFIGLVRPTGVLLALPLVDTALAGRRISGFWNRSLAAAAMPLLGLAAYAAYVRHTTGHWLAWMTAQSFWGRQPAPPWRPFAVMLTSLTNRGFEAYVLANPYDLINAAAVAFVLASVIPVTRRLGIGMGGFVLFSILIPLTAGGLLCIGRFTSVLFPIFLWLGLRERPSRALLVGLAAGEALLAALFFTDRGIF